MKIHIFAPISSNKKRKSVYQLNMEWIDSSIIIGNGFPIKETIFDP